MTKQSYFWATPSGPINLMKAEDMPVKDFPDFWPKAKAAYESALQAAKESSVPIQDQFQARLLIYIKNNSEDIKPDTIYGPFSLRYEIQERHSVRCAAHTSEALKKRGHVPGECTCKCEVVAILYDDTPERDQLTPDKFTRAVKLINGYQAGMSEYFRMHDYRNMYALWEKLTSEINGIK